MTLSYTVFFSPSTVHTTHHSTTMNIAIGIDVGISTTKIVGIRDGKVISPLRIKANDPITSLYGAFGKYLYDNKIELSQIDKVMLTGVGAAYIDKPLYGVPTEHVDEFMCDGLGAKYQAVTHSLFRYDSQKQHFKSIFRFVTR